MRDQQGYPDAERHAAAWVLTLGVFFALAVLVTTGCIPAEAIEQARLEQGVNLGHAADESLHPDARRVGRDNYDAWSAQRYSLEGKRLPGAVEDRLRARGALPEGYGE